MATDGSSARETTDTVTIELTAPEALVLFELLARWGPTDASEVGLEHPAEWRVLWDLLAILESKLAEPFLPDYYERVEQAREMLRDAAE